MNCIVGWQQEQWKLNSCWLISTAFISFILRTCFLGILENLCLSLSADTHNYLLSILTGASTLRSLHGHLTKHFFYYFIIFSPPQQDRHNISVGTSTNKSICQPIIISYNLINFLVASGWDFLLLKKCSKTISQKSSPMKNPNKNETFPRNTKKKGKKGRKCSNKVEVSTM